MKTDHDAQVVVHESLVTMLLWPSVPVRRRVDHDLTVIDRFVVEAAQRLAPMRPEDVEEVTGVPREAVARIADRLVGLHVLERTAAGYHAADVASTVLQRRTVPQYRPAQMTFLYLPDTDEMVAFPPGPQATNAPQLQRTTPVGATRLADEVSALRQSELLGRRIADGAVTGLPADIVEVDDAPDRMPMIVPQYRCRGSVRRTDGGEPELTLQILGGRVRVTARLTGVPLLAARWTGVAERAGDAGSAWTATGGAVTSTRLGDTAWRYGLDDRAAAVADAAGVILSEPGGLLIRCNDDIAYLDAEFEPLDDGARLLFARQSAFRSVSALAPEKVTRALLRQTADRAVTAFDLPRDMLTVDSVLDELWQRRFYQHVYAARREEDFADV
ncbi:hypothetical protein ACFQZ4_04945 [Catellatospora coxensis]|uniref:hypothetical protein n=1 Tax=Catellatospora coxensis TaxID=310354 RepID=UPI0019427F91|nr:hypothetical protein [Catellatospora coxensis]